MSTKLVFLLFFFRQKKIKNITITRKASTDPITIPAIAPPESLNLFLWQDWQLRHEFQVPNSKFCMSGSGDELLESPPWPNPKL
ncbi:hypothetical protein TB2_022528 [Malus domestica]